MTLHANYPFSFPSNLNTAEALRQHHFQRFLHYQALAEQADQQARQMKQQLDMYDTGMNNINANPSATYGYANPEMKVVTNAMPMQSAPMQQQPFAPIDMWQSAPAPVAPVINYHAQAQAHMQAHQAAQSSFNMVPAPFFMPAQDNTWSRQSMSASSSASASVPTTPAAMMSVPMITSATAPSTVAMSRVASSEGEYELDHCSVFSEDDIKPQLPTDIPLTNLNGGGRGYVPGETPDDPKKRHRCSVCGRSFARAFNLKSHIQTHNPLRSKPHVCPHNNCRRGFSRLHDLERHRQGIHSDGPLVEAKAHNVAPSVARAKSRIQKRADTGSLI